MTEGNLDSLIERAADLIIGAEKVVVFTGAGISTESGIPDFRGPGGVWERFDPDEFTYEKFIFDSRARRKHWQLLSGDLQTAGAQPNPAHYAIAELDRLGKLDCVITQNVDNLHQKGGVPGSKVFELHGNMHWVVCLQCGRRYTFEQVKVRLEKTEFTPDCEFCHGILKPDVVFFGESLPYQALQNATRHAANCSLFIVIGSSLVVYPAAYMPEYAVRAGAKLAIINLSPTPMDEQAAVVIRGKAGEVLPKIVKLVQGKSHAR